METAYCTIWRGCRACKPIYSSCSTVVVVIVVVVVVNINTSSVV